MRLVRTRFASPWSTARHQGTMPVSAPRSSRTPATSPTSSGTWRASCWAPDRHPSPRVRRASCLTGRVSDRPTAGSCRAPPPRSLAVDRAIAQYAFGDASQILYEAVWNEYCDWGVELAKIRLSDDRLAPAEREATWWTLVEVLDTYLRLLHPIMPFITEAIWERLPKAAGDPALLIVADWPTAGAEAVDSAAEVEVSALIDLVRGVRNARAEARIEPGAWLPVDVFVPESLGPTYRGAPARNRAPGSGPAAGPRARSRIHSTGSGGRAVGHRRRDRSGCPASCQRRCSGRA